MFRHAHIILALLILGYHARAQEHGPAGFVSLKLHESSFEELAARVEEQTGVQIYYKEDWVNDIRVSVSGDSLELLQVVRDALRGSGLYQHFLPPGRLVLLPDRGISNDLSHLYQEGEGTEMTGMRLDEKQNRLYMEVSKPDQIVETIVVGKRSGGSRSVARIHGRIQDKESGEPIIGATMVVMENGKGSVSDQHGTLSMSLEPGRYNVHFSFIGMETYSCRLEVISDGEFLVEMQSAIIALNEVQIVGNHYRQINSTDVGVERLSMKSVKQMPLFMGENDVIKISRLLPGITSAGEASVGVNVRGGSADQNIFYINRVPVYNTSHMFGFLSAFNSDIVQDFSVYKGNVPVNYGGRLSSVFNIITRKGNRKMFSAQAGISPVSANVTLEGPIKKDVASILISGRTSYSDWMLKRMEDPLLRDSKANFYDFSGVLSAHPSEKNDFNLFYYQSYDHFAYGDLSEYEYGNRGGSLIWKHSYSPALSSNLTLASSGYTFGNIEKQEISQSYKHNYRLNHNELVAEFTWSPGLNHQVHFGSDLVHYFLDRGTVLPEGEASLRIPTNLGLEKGIEGSLFLSDKITITPWLSMYAGLRYSAYTALGPRTVRIYQEEMPITESNVVDSLSFGNNESLGWESGPEIRSAINLKAGANTSFKLSFSQMKQFLFMLSNTVTISPIDQWKLSDYHIRPPKGNQYTAGIHHVWPRWGLSNSVEVYYKKTENIVEFRDGADFLGSSFTEVAVLQGDQEAYGAEFMFQKSSGRLDGWLSYVYSRSMVQVKGDSEFESINRGEVYPSNFDRPHVLNLIWSYHFNRRFTVSSNMVYMSGRPVTFPASLYFIKDYVYIDYYAKNQVRVPDYFRVDASVSVEGNLKRDKLFHSTWSLNVYNLLGRNNPQSIFFEPKESYLKAFSFSVIGVPIITLAWSVKLGNYESN